jgi:hypothetical protein
MEQYGHLKLLYVKNGVDEAYDEKNENCDDHCSSQLVELRQIPTLLLEHLHYNILTFKFPFLCLKIGFCSKNRFGKKIRRFVGFKVRLFLRTVPVSMDFWKWRRGLKC